MNKFVIHRSEQIYDLLLKFYPQGYRYEFEEEMKYVFSESLKDAYSERGALGIIHLWAMTMMDAGKSLVIEHLENQKGDTMKTKNTDLFMQNKIILWVAIATGLLLLIPTIGMLVSDEWQWSPVDFIFMGALLFGTGLTFVLVARKMNNLWYRLAVGLAVMSGLMLIFITAAVQIIGDEDPANVMYAGVLAVGAIGAVIGRFEARGMARALFAMAGANTLVAVIALIFFPTVSPGLLGILILNMFFTALWTASGFLFQRAGAVDSKVNV